jgi:hypothetical protein
MYEDQTRLNLCGPYRKSKPLRNLPKIKKPFLPALLEAVLLGGILLLSLLIACRKL